MFQNFPYTDMHQLNLDWIVKIAKDFLEQYTHIQETISDGETSLEAKALELTTALQAWYDEHSQDISEELEESIQSLQTALATAIANFNTSADAKAQQTIESIPDDYSTLANTVLNMENADPFYNFGYLTNGLNWDTVNKVVTLKSGYLTFGNNYKRIATDINLSYTNFNNATVLLYYNDNFTLVPFLNITKGVGIAIFVKNKIYCPFENSKITVNTLPITSVNILNDYQPFAYHLECLLKMLQYNDFTITNTGSTQLGTNQLFVDVLNVIPGGTLLKTIKMPQADTSNIDISLWKKSGNVLTKYASYHFTEPSEDSYITLPINRFITEPTVIGYISHNTNFYGSATSTETLVYIADSSVTEYTYSTVINFNIAEEIEYARINLESPNIFHVGDEYYFTEIQDVLDTVELDEYTIILHPRKIPYKRFSMIRHLDESYPWNGITKVKHISIIGTDKTNCIVRDDSGKYYSSTAEIATNGTIKNITFISTHDNASWASGDVPGYAVHIDNRPADINGMNVIFENCIFISEQSAAVGVGVYANQSVTFMDCEFYNNTPQDFEPYSGYPSSTYNTLGALIAHTSMGLAHGNDHLKCINNLFITKNNINAITLRETETNPTCKLLMIGNTLWNEHQNAAVIAWEGSGIFIQENYNRLNNNNGINKIS